MEELLTREIAAALDDIREAAIMQADFVTFAAFAAPGNVSTEEARWQVINALMNDADLSKVAYIAESTER